MPIVYPTTLDSFANPTSTTPMDDAAFQHDVVHGNHNDAVEALEAKVGITGSAVTTSHDYRLASLETKADRFVDAFDHGAVADGVTNDTAAIVAAIAATPVGGTLVLQAGSYLLSGAGTELLLINKDINLLGAGKEKTKLLVAASVGATTDVIRVAVAGTVRGMRLGDFSITVASGAPARYGIHIDTGASGQQWAYCCIEHVFVSQLGSYAVFVTGGAVDRFFDNRIFGCKLDGGFKGTNLGDAITFEQNLCAGIQTGFYGDFVSGAGMLRLINNVFVGNAGGIYLEDASGALIFGNQFEALVTSTLTENAFIVLKGGAAEIANTRICYNHFIMTPVMVTYGLYVDNANFTLVEGNLFELGDVNSRLANITASAIDTVFYNNSATGAYGGEKIVDAGSRTAVEGQRQNSLPLAFTNGDTTPSVAAGNLFYTGNTAATTITNLDDGKQGQVVRVVFQDSLTTIDFTGTNLKGNAGVDWTPAANDWMECLNFSSGVWMCSVHDTTV